MKWLNALEIFIFFFAIYIFFVFLGLLKWNTPFTFQIWVYLIGIIPFFPLPPTFNCNFWFDFPVIILMIINMVFHANNWISFIDRFIRHIFYGWGFMMGSRTQRLFVTFIRWGWFIADFFKRNGFGFGLLWLSFPFIYCPLPVLNNIIIIQTLNDSINSSFTDGVYCYFFCNFVLWLHQTLRSSNVFEVELTNMFCINFRLSVKFWVYKKKCCPQWSQPSPFI